MINRKYIHSYTLSNGVLSFKTWLTIAPSLLLLLILLALIRLFIGRRFLFIFLVTAAPSWDGVRMIIYLIIIHFKVFFLLAFLTWQRISTVVLYQRRSYRLREVGFPEVLRSFKTLFLLLFMLFQYLYKLKLHQVQLTFESDLFLILWL